MVKIVDGKKISNEILSKLKKQVGKLSIKPNLAVILVGNDPASQLYVRIKEKKCQEVGIGFKKFVFGQEVDQKKIISLIEELNQNPKISGIIIQLPLPDHLDTNRIICAISPLKDVDGLHPENLGKLLIGAPSVVPPTPAAILEILNYYHVDLKAKHVVLVGYGKLVGKPLAAMLATAQKDATITICNKDTKNLADYTKQADILITAIGVPNLIKAEMIKKGTIMIDAGTTVIKIRNPKSEIRKKFRVSSFEFRVSHVVGDVDFEKVKKIASLITPPVGGVGPVTVAKLLENVTKIKNQK